MYHQSNGGTQISLLCVVYYLMSMSLSLICSKTECSIDPDVDSSNIRVLGYTG